MSAHLHIVRLGKRDQPVAVVKHELALQRLGRVPFHDVFRHDQVVLRREGVGVLRIGLQRGNRDCRADGEIALRGQRAQRRLRGS
jgi:hypothetical protein